MIEVALIGGLGNQMFEYAAARQLQQRYGGEITLNKHFYKYDKSDRTFMLDRYILNDNVHSVDKSDWIFGCGLVIDKVCHKLTSKMMRAMGRCFDKGSQYNNLDVIAKNGNIKMMGYFQSEMYFHDIHDILRNEFVLKGDISRKNKQIIHEVHNNNSVCIHIRRGDYVLKNMMICDEMYYHKAMDLLRAKINNPTFYVFSDDFEWVKENLSAPDIVYVDYDNEPHIDLEIMKCFRFFVLSNSSFGWWAQYLSVCNNKLVVAPKLWAPNDTGKRDIYMSDWIVLNE